ncbi:hypothetical protein Zm00014a_044398 [Zea mays]|uniref:Senescence regulator n=1 Tax=Zea mays TaxID=4577 RepID=A0A3L6G026_MAIZE|nr:hypothetical protein Zm00014a_044398 [Zea mays]
MAKARRSPFAAAERFLGFPRGGPSRPGAVAPAPAALRRPAGPRRGRRLVLGRRRRRQRPGEPTRHGVQASGGGGGQARPAAGRPEPGVRRRARAAGGAASAPVEVPAWPARFAFPDADPSLLFEMEMGGDDHDDDDDEGREGDDGRQGQGAGWVPPHVYLARRQARASVVEGAGRTLKGRDMSRVRDAVWSRTGFDG